MSRAFDIAYVVCEAYLASCPVEESYWMTFSSTLTVQCGAAFPQAVKI